MSLSRPPRIADCERLHLPRVDPIHTAVVREHQHVHLELDGARRMAPIALRRPLTLQRRCLPPLRRHVDGARTRAAGGLERRAQPQRKPAHPRDAGLRRVPAVEKDSPVIIARAAAVARQLCVAHLGSV
eukprot:scaffold10092_cov66-Phaeocystis_antarctica.AAC.1